VGWLGGIWVKVKANGLKDEEGEVVDEDSEEEGCSLED
jgi:hypothetical protein